MRVIGAGPARKAAGEMHAAWCDEAEAMAFLIQQCRPALRASPERPWVLGLRFGDDGNSVRGEWPGSGIADHTREGRICIHGGQLLQTCGVLRGVASLVGEPRTRLHHSPCLLYTSRCV